MMLFKFSLSSKKMNFLYYLSHYSLHIKEKQFFRFFNIEKNAEFLAVVQEICQ